MWLCAAWLACAIEPIEEEPSIVYPVDALWTTDVAVGTRVTIGPILVTSGRTRDQRFFFGSAPEGGPRSGVAIALGAVLDDWPPEVGTEIQLTASVLRSNPTPILELSADIDGSILGWRDGPAATLWSEDPAEQLELTYALVTAPDLTVTSRPDPLGEADSDGSVGIGGRFGVSPGYGRTGDLLGIADELRISARSAEDWGGTLQGDIPLAVTLEDIEGLPEGTPVLVEDLLLATPWSRDGRWAVAQDATGRGVWLDGESWGMAARVQPGMVGRFLGEVRHPPEGVVLRIWDTPEIDSERRPLLREELDDGAIVRVDIHTLSPPNVYGERIADGVLLIDDRFTDISALPAPSTVIGAVRKEPDGSGWLAVFEP